MGSVVISAAEKATFQRTPLEVLLEYRPIVRPLIDSPEKAAEQLAFIRNEMREFFVCLSLDAAGRMICRRVVSIGTLTASLVHPREVFRGAILDGAASVIVGHNHPSGSLEVSRADREVTERLRRAGEVLGIGVLNHIVVTSVSYYVISH